MKKQHMPKSWFYSMVIIMGTLVILSYMVLLPRVNTQKDINALWFGIRGHLRYFYYVSIGISAIAFVINTIWLLMNPIHLHKMWMPYFVFLIGAIGWSMTLWFWGNYTSRHYFVWNIVLKVFVVLALVVTSVGACGMLYQAIRNRFNTWIIMMYAYICFHVIVLDNIGWTIHFLTSSY